MKSASTVLIRVTQILFPTKVLFLACVFLLSCSDTNSPETQRNQTNSQEKLSFDTSIRPFGSESTEHDSSLLLKLSRNIQSQVVLSSDINYASKLTYAEEIISSITVDENLWPNKEVSNADIASLSEMNIYPGFLHFDKSRILRHDSDRNYNDGDIQGVAIIIQIYYEKPQRGLAKQVLKKLKNIYQQQTTIYIKKKIAMEVQDNDSLGIFRDPRLAKCVLSALMYLNTIDLTLIKKLACQNAEIDDLAGLGALSNLKALYLQNNKLTSLETLEKIPSLKVISTAGNNQLVSLKGIENATNLEEIQANNCWILTDISAISSIKNLKILGAMQARISDISAFEYLHELEEIVLNGNEISNIDALSDKSKLVRLYLSNNPINSFEPLFTNKKLKGLGVGKKDTKHCATFIKLKKTLSSDATFMAPKSCNID